MSTEGPDYKFKSYELTFILNGDRPRVGSEGYEVKTQAVPGVWAILAVSQLLDKLF
jgi:hypothetical protein